MPEWGESGRLTDLKAERSAGIVGKVREMDA